MRVFTKIYKGDVEMESPLKPYEGAEPYVFVSYSHKDSEKVFAILQRLQSEGIKIWYDNGIEQKGSHSYYIDIAVHPHFGRICNCKYFIAFHSKNSANSERCKNEISFARRGDINKNFLSVYLEKTELSLGVMMKINRFPSINFYDYDESELEKFYAKLLIQTKHFLLRKDDDDNKKPLTTDAGATAAVTGLTMGAAASSTVTQKSWFRFPLIAGVGAVAGGVVDELFAPEKDDKKSLEPYDGNEPYVFISYSHEDSNKVFDILGKLQSAGLRFWYDAGTKKGSEWQECIAEHIRDCECVIAFHSQNSSTSEHCKDEISFAKWREINKKILSVYLENVKLSLGIQMAILRFQYLNFYEYAADKRRFFAEFLESPLIQSCLSR